MLKWDLNIKDMNADSYSEVEKDGNIQSCKNVRMLTFFFYFEKSNFDRQYIQMWFESWENKCGFMLERSKLVKTDKIVKSQNVDFLVWKVKV